MTGTETKTCALDSQARAQRIRELNDQFRTTMSGGQVVATPGVRALGRDLIAWILHRLIAFDTFTTDNDPYGEHDFGAIDLGDEGQLFWKIDYYDKTLSGGSPDPADPAVTARVMTLMLASEY